MNIIDIILKSLAIALMTGFGLFIFASLIALIAVTSGWV